MYLFRAREYRRRDERVCVSVGAVGWVGWSDVYVVACEILDVCIKTSFLEGRLLETVCRVTFACAGESYDAFMQAYFWGNSHECVVAGQARDVCIQISILGV